MSDEYTVLDTERAHTDRQRANEQAVNADRQTAAYFTEVFGSAAGQEVLKKLNQFCYMDASTFSAESQSVTVFREGQRNVALWIKAWLTYEKELENAQS